MLTANEKLFYRVLEERASRPLGHTWRRRPNHPVGPQDPIDLLNTIYGVSTDGLSRIF